MRGATSRNDTLQRRTKYIWSLVLGLIVLFIFVATIGFGLMKLYSYTQQPKRATNYNTMDALGYTRTNDPDDTIYAYVIKDPDYGIEYIVTDHGGICPRIRSSNGDS